MGISGHEWIGVDGCLCATASGALGADAAKVLRLRHDGGRVAASVPADAVFFERIDVANASWRAAAALVQGKMDLSLPVPVEKCSILAIPVKTSATPLFMAFAMPLESCAARSEAFRERHGCSPEALFPETAALWYGAICAGAPSSMVLCASGGRLTLVAVDEGSIAGAMSFRAGDGSLVGRNARLLAMRCSRKPARMLVAGGDATPELVSSLQRMLGDMCGDISRVDSPDIFLARSLARLASVKGLEGGFLSGSLRHPAAAARAAAKWTRLACLAFAASLVALALSARRLAAAARELHERNDTLSSMAAEVAGMRLPETGRAAAERARNMLDWRNPVFAARTARRPLEAFPDVVAVAEKYGATFSRIEYDGRRLAIHGSAQAAADIDAMRRVAADSGFSVSADVSKRDGALVFDLRIEAMEGEGL